MNEIGYPEVVAFRVKLEEHPNANRLAIVRVPRNNAGIRRVAVVRKDEWDDGLLGAFVPSGWVVEDVGYFGDKIHAAIQRRTLRGVVSEGLLFHAPAGSEEGDDVADIFGLSRLGVE